MSTLNTTRTVKTLALGALLSLAGVSSFAAGSPEQVYQRVVGGQSAGFSTAASATPSNVRVEERLIPGPRAAYAIHTGVAKDEAIAQARAAGEVPTRQVVRITDRSLSPAEKWARVNDVTAPAWEKVEVLSSTPDRGPAALARGDKAGAI